MRKKHITAGFIGILTLTVLIFIIIFSNSFQANSALELLSKHLLAGILFLIALRTASNIFPVIPAGMIIFAAIPILGWFPAFVYNLTGLLLGKSLAFFLARIYREPLVETFATLKKIQELEKQITGKKQFLALVVFKTFTVPVVDISSYVIGLTKISFFKFFLVTFLAALPTIATFYLGEAIYNRFFGNHLLMGVVSMLILGSIYLIIKKYGFKKDSL